MWTPITPSKLKNDLIEEAKRLGNTHDDDINAFVILVLSCRLADEINRNTSPVLKDCISQD